MMTNGIEGTGDIVTGALLARSAESEAGDGKASHEERAAYAKCLNCGTELTGPFCSACGQNAHVHRSLTALGHDIGHGVFHFEGKVWRTLPMLAFHPGSLTKRYIAGERARFVSPMALFLFSVFLLFAVIHSLGGELATADPFIVNEQTVANLDQNAAKIEAQLATARAQQAANPNPAQAKRIEALQKAANTVEATREAFGKNYEKDQINFRHLKTGWTRLDEGIEKAGQNPNLMIYKLQTSAYKYSWALIPISVPFVALLFLWCRQFQLYDHAIFVTYSLAFMMLFVVLLSVAGALGVADGAITFAAMTVPIVHMFAQLRGAYDLGKPSALWRTAALTIFAFLALTTFTMLLLAMGLME